MKYFSKLAAAAALSALTATGAQAATLGLATDAPAATGEGFVSIDGGTLDMFGDVTGALDPANLFAPVFLLIDPFGGDFEFDLDTTSVTDIGYSGQTLELLLSDDLPGFPSGVLLTVTGGVFANIDASPDFTSFLDNFYPVGVFDQEVTFALAELAPIPLPASFASLAFALGAVGVWSRRKTKTC